MPSSERTIVILGPPGDAVLERFHRFCTDRGVPSHRVNDMRSMPFVLTFGNSNGSGARLLVNGCEMSLDNIGLFIRGAGHLMHATLDSAFARGEYFSALWALASQAPNIVNKPGRWAWESRIAQEQCFGEGLLLPRSASHTIRYLLERLSTLAPTYAQVDVASAIERKEFSLDGTAQPNACPDKGIYRGQFVERPLYLIELFAGPRARVILDETACGPANPSYQKLRNKILAFARTNSLEHFAAVTLFIAGCARLVKIDTEPPPCWYDGCAADIFDGLLEVLLSPTPPVT